MRDNIKEEARRGFLLSGGNGFGVGQKVDVARVGEGLGADVGVGEVQCLVAQGFQ